MRRTARAWGRNRRIPRTPDQENIVNLRSTLYLPIRVDRCAETGEGFWCTRMPTGATGTC
jgi:hypothetical protein